MDELVIKVSPRKMLLYGLGGAAVAVAGCYNVIKQEEAAGWVGIVAGTIMAIGCMISALRDSRAMVIGKDGFSLYDSSGDLIPWSEIATIYSVESRNSTFIHIEVNDPERFKERYPGLGARLFDNEIMFSGDGFTLGAEDIEDAMMRARSGLTFTPEQIEVSASTR